MLYRTTDLYDPLSMPPDLKAAHDVLDKAVDDCYGKTKFTSDVKRVGYLFELYDGLVKKVKNGKRVIFLKSPPTEW